MLTNWDKKFVDSARLVASWSKDPSTKVGCVIVDDDHNQLATGYNGFPRNVSDCLGRLKDRNIKLKYTVHAEANAVAAAARNGHSLRQSTAYVTLSPCSQCAALLIQAGIKRVVFDDAKWDKKVLARWGDDFNFAIAMLQEAGVRTLLV